MNWPHILCAWTYGLYLRADVVWALGSEKCASSERSISFHNELPTSQAIVSRK